MELARDVCERDDEVDELFSKAVLEMSQVLQQNMNLVSQATDYMFIAKYIERMADHATNIAEWAIYVVTGNYQDLNKHMFGSEVIGLNSEAPYPTDEE